MFEKIQLKKEWQLSLDTTRNYYGQELHRERIVKITDGEYKCDVILSAKKKIVFLSDPDFYGSANRSFLERAHIIPNELLEVETCSCIESECKTKITIKKIDSNKYSVEIYSKEYNGRSLHSPEVNIKETMNKEMLDERLKHIPDVFEVYPFLSLPLGNCFDCCES